MKRFLNILAVVLISAAISSLSVEAQSRSGRGSSQTSQQKNGPATTNNQQGHGNKNSGRQNKIRPVENGPQKTRPTSKSPVNATKATPPTDNRPGNNGSSARPGNGGHGHDNNSSINHGNQNRPNGNGGSSRPNNNGGNGRPGNGSNHGNGNNRPDNNAFRPDNKPNPGGNHGGGSAPHPGKPGTPPAPAYGYGPGGDRWHGHFNDIPHHAPHRPMLPPPPPNFYRPVPPPTFRPAPQAPRFGTILGIALGSALNYTLNQLFNTGYYVTGYTNNAIYLNDVLMLNMVWPNATLQYNRGLLTGSEFVYPSPYYNTDIYYRVYNTLQSSYGIPVSMEYLAGGGMQATWFGYDGRYVSLSFQGGTAMDGQMRYYTTLSFGN